MGKEWTDDEVQALIRETVGIAKEDKIMSSVKGLHDRLDKLFPTGDPKPGDPGAPPPPPPADPKASGDKGKRPNRSLWWGEVNE